MRSEPPSRCSPTARAVAAVLALDRHRPADPSDGRRGDAKPSAASRRPDRGDGKIKIPDDLKDKLKEHGIDLDKWKNGEWKNWDKDDWLREAEDFVNPIIEDLWDPDRMREADKTPEHAGRRQRHLGRPGRDRPDAGAGARRRRCRRRTTTTRPESGKVFFDGPEGSMVCSATVVKDPAHPGKSNMVWTAGHCVHAGKKRRLVPQHRLRARRTTTRGKSAAELENAPSGGGRPVRRLVGRLGADLRRSGSRRARPTGGEGAPYDFAVLHVTPEKGGRQVAGGDGRFGAAGRLQRPGRAEDRRA